jgi:subtilisin family serine protease
MTMKRLPLSKRRLSRLISTLLLAVFVLGMTPARAAAEDRLIVRAGGLLGGLPVVKSACRILGCNVLYAIDGTVNNLLLVAVPDVLDTQLLVKLLSIVPGILDVEVDQVVYTEGTGGTGVPAALLDKTMVDYYGTKVRRGYITQPAFEILGLGQAHDQLGLTGRGVTVAVIDTGVDTEHPVLKSVLVSGYDFTRNREGGAEQGDINQSTMAILDGRSANTNQSTMAILDDAKPGFVNQSTMAVLDQSTMAILDGPEYAAFGHGTMVAGVVHLAAPRAKIMPLKAFHADGSGYASDVLRAIYMASNRGAKVINMSFSFSYKSRELERALTYATGKGAIAVSSAGNDGKKVNVYPASLPTVMGVASTTDWDTLSDFSNFGTNVAWIAAPGEGIITTYPLKTWAASWGTSFSTPFAAGTAAMLAESAAAITNTQAADAAGNAVWVSWEVTKGRLHAPSAIRAARKKTLSLGGLLW